MQPTERNHLVNFILAFVPDIAVGWVVARLTESGWSGFFYNLLARLLTAPLKLSGVGCYAL